MSKRKEEQIVQAHITCKNGMTLASMQESIDIFDESIKEFYLVQGLLQNPNNYQSPKVCFVENGSLVVSIVVPIACALIPVVYDIIKTAFARRGNKYNIEVKEAKFKWTYEDNRKVCKIVLKEYAVNKKDTPLNKIVGKIKLSKPYGRVSIEDKIRNTKYLMEKHHIENTLKCGKFAKHSHDNELALIEVAKSFNLL